MPSLVFLAAVLSLDVTRQLVALGYGLGFDTDLANATQNKNVRYTNVIRPTLGTPYPPLAITGCTGNGAPIVITTAYPHGVSNRGIGGMSCIVSGVTGNTAANNISTDPNDRTVGLNQGVLAVPLTPTTLALYGQDQDPASATVGKLIPLVGNGAWTGGGTVTPAFTDGSILLGLENVREQSAPPRIVLVPTVIEKGPRSNAIPNANRTQERYVQRQQRSTASDGVTFEVHCWGQRQPPDAAYDFDVCLAMQQAVEDSAYLLFGVKQENRAGRFADQKVRETQFIKAGHLLISTLRIDVPVLDNSLAFIPAGSSFGVTVETPTPEIGATFNVAIN